MHSTNFTIPARNIRSSREIQPGLLPAAITAVRWLARKISERRNRNALMELSDDQLKEAFPGARRKATFTSTVATEHER